MMPYSHRGGGRSPASLSPVPQIAAYSNKPWAIVHSPPGQKPRITQAYANRQDAEDALRFLKRWVKNPNNFSVAFMGETDTSIEGV
jgi:hypothetical protein